MHLHHFAKSLETERAKPLLTPDPLLDAVLDKWFENDLSITWNPPSRAAQTGPLWETKRRVL